MYPFGATVTLPPPPPSFMWNVYKTFSEAAQALVQSASTNVKPTSSALVVASFSGCGVIFVLVRRVRPTRRGAWARSTLSDYASAIAVGQDARLCASLGAGWLVSSPPLA